MDQDSPQLREGMKAVINDCAATLCREVDAAPDQTAVDEIGKRVGLLTSLLTPCPIAPPAGFEKII
jgi:hypothetical protein